MKYELTEHQIKNLFIFLDRVSITGLKEITAMQEIIQSFNSPIKEEKLNKANSEF